MKKTWPVPSETKLVVSENIPEKLFVCSAKIKAGAGTDLKNAFEKVQGLPQDLEAIHNKHLSYTYDLGEKGLYWEAGASVDFTQILYIFSTDSLEEAQKLMHNDPLYKAGIFYNDWWFEWAIHSPPWKASSRNRAETENLMRSVGILPTYPPEVRPQVTEIKVEIMTPPRLVVSLARTNVERVKKIEQDHKAGKPVPAFLIHHVYNRLGPGGTAQMGFDWAAGPSADSSYDLSIFAVTSIPMAKLLRENELFAQHGIFYDYQYFEWCILSPFRKVSPTYKEALKRLLISAGVNLKE